MLSTEAELKEAKALAKSGDFDHALGYVNDVLMHDPRNTEALFILGAIYYKLRRPAQAADSWNKVLAIDPAHEKARQWLQRVAIH